MGKMPPERSNFGCWQHYQGHNATRRLYLSAREAFWVAKCRPKP